MRVKFQYSKAYDHMLTLMALQQYQDSQAHELKSFIYDLEAKWIKEEKNIIKEIEKVSGLKFPKDVECYIVKDMAYTAVSHPLTVKLDRDFDRLKLVLIHELIHVVLASHGKCRDLVIALNEKYPTRDEYFKTHIPVFMIQKKVFQNLYGSKANKQYQENEIFEEELPILKEANKLSRNFSSNIIKFFR